MKRLFLVLVVLGLTIILGFGQVSNDLTPRLVIGITIDHMRADYINRYWDSFQNGGFKRLVSGGAVCNNVRTDIHNLKTSTVISTLTSGTYPSEHGIVGDKWYKQLTQEEVFAVTDKFYLTLGSDSDEGCVSARQLKVFNLGDMLKQQSNLKSKVFSVALNANAAVLSAGHVADGAYWYDKSTGNFITSSYFIDQFPDWIIEFNNKKFADLYLQREWDLLLPESSYKAGFEDAYVLEDGFYKKWNVFPYDLQKISSSQPFPKEFIKATPFGNKMIRDFCVQLISQENLGMDNNTDLLNINFSTLDYANKWFNPNSVEIQETYLRLDTEIASLLSYLDKTMGKDNYLVYLTAASTSNYPVKILKDDFNFDAKEFKPESAMALLRAYLNAMYGVGEWIQMYSEEQVYLNHNLIEKKEKPLNEMRQATAHFLNQFTGVKSAVSANLIESGNLNNPRFKVLENSYCVQRSGDILLLLDEGWYPTYRYNQVDYSTENKFPLLFYGMYVKPGKIDKAVELIDVVPTVCKFIKILPPDDAKGNVLTEIFW